jgi:Protein of unknown function (DUF2934)
MGQQSTEQNNVFTGGPQASGATMAPPRRAGTKSRPATTNGKITHEQIAKRAHEIWVKQGCRHGSDQEHWFEAERQLKAELAGK